MVGLSESRQRASLHQAGIPKHAGAPIYADTPRSYPKQLQAMLRSLRPSANDTVIVHRLCVLGRDRKDLRTALNQIKAKQATVMEADTGRHINPDDCADAVLDAVNWYSSRVKHFADIETAAEAGSRGGKTTARLFRKHRMPKVKAFEIWSDRTLSTDEALAKINADPQYGKPWSASAAYEHLGPRGAFPGRRPRKK